MYLAYHEAKIGHKVGLMWEIPRRNQDSDRIGGVLLSSISISFSQFDIGQPIPFIYLVDPERFQESN